MPKDLRSQFRRALGAYLMHPGEDPRGTWLRELQEVALIVDAENQGSSAATLVDLLNVVFETKGTSTS
jgi:hypothetical protein